MSRMLTTPETRRSGHFVSSESAASNGEERLWIDPRFRDRLARAGLTSFAAIMGTTRGRLLRALPDRENWRLDLPDGTTGPQGAYLKKHHIRSWRNWLRARLGKQLSPTPGSVEADNVARLERDGIATMRLVACGEKLHADGLAESFVITEELAGHLPLDDYIRRQFPRLIDQPGRSFELDKLIYDVAAVARRFHECGYNHRDFYCCHFFVRQDEQGRYEVKLIDLQRVEQRQRLRGRWIVKDLAQLAYSAPRERVSRTHRLAFIKHYLGVRKLRPQDKRLIRRVLAKQRQMQRRLGVHP